MVVTNDDDDEDVVVVGLFDILTILNHVVFFSINNTHNFVISSFDFYQFTNPKKLIHTIINFYLSFIIIISTKIVIIFLFFIFFYFFNHTGGLSTTAMIKIHVIDVSSNPI